MPQASLFETTEVLWRQDKKSEWQTTKICEIPKEEILVLSWNGRSFIQAEATLGDLQYQEKYVRLQLGNGIKLSVGLDQLFPLVGVSPIDPRVSSVMNNGLIMVKAVNLKPGDRILSTDDQGIIRSPSTLVGKANPGVCVIAKAKVRSCEPSVFYSLVVPVFQTCILGSGVFINSN